MTYVNTVLSTMTCDQLRNVELALIGGLSNDDFLSFISQYDMMTRISTDPLTKAMENGQMWGDLMLSAKPSDFSCEPVAKKECLPEDWDWEMPTLKLRKDIWAAFPVIVDKLESKDGRDRYSVQWNRKQFLQDRENVDNYLDYMDFEDIMYRRLVVALNASRNWTVETARNTKEICVIAMNFDTEKAAATAATAATATKLVLPDTKCEDSDAESVVSEASDASDVSESWEVVGKPKVAVAAVPVVPAVPTAAAPATAATPVFRRLTDIKEKYPVIWNDVSPSPSTKVYALEVFGKKAREMGLNMVLLKAELLMALEKSPSWIVRPAASDKEFCRLEMKVRAA